MEFVLLGAVQKGGTIYSQGGIVTVPHHVLSCINTHFSPHFHQQRPPSVKADGQPFRLHSALREDNREGRPLTQQFGGVLPL